MASMIAYGAARYALVRGDRAKAETLWPLIEWCLEYCRRKLNVVITDLEKRVIVDKVIKEGSFLEVEIH